MILDGEVLDLLEKLANKAEEGDEKQRQEVANTLFQKPGQGLREIL